MRGFESLAVTFLKPITMDTIKIDVQLLANTLIDTSVPVDTVLRHLYGEGIGEHYMTADDWTELDSLAQDCSSCGIWTEPDAMIEQEDGYMLCSYCDEGKKC